MIHDETTTEIELPWAKKKEAPKQKVIAMDFSKSKVTKAKALERIELSSPWVLRLALLLAVVILSLFVL